MKRCTVSLLPLSTLLLQLRVSTACSGTFELLLADSELPENGITESTVPSGSATGLNDDFITSSDTSEFVFELPDGERQVLLREECVDLLDI